MARPAHRLADKTRTSDVHVSEDVTFAGLLLSEPVLLGLRRAGFERPSPIQLRAIPLGRCAVDLIVQAKSGTGKTCVLAVLALEVLVSAPPSGRCRALVLAPTREVAVQVAQVIAAIGAEVPGLAVHTLIGGLPLAQDVANLRRCNIAVGTPGRVRQLVDSEALNTDSVRLFVMDEADKLMEDAFVDDINFIYSTLPASKQMVALSATYPESLANLLARYMRSPTFVRLGKSSAALLGIRQYVLTVPHEPLVTKQLKLKLDALVNMLSTVSFTQCLVFSNHQTRAETLCSQLSARGWPSAHLSSSLSQERRLEALSQLTSLRCRVLVTTDLGARGVDSEHADLVVQLDVPWDGATYLHRVGRAGRYGSLGAAVALVSVGDEERRLTTVLAAAGVSPLRLPDALPSDLKTCPTDGWPLAVPAQNGGEGNGHGENGNDKERCAEVGRSPGGGGDTGRRGRSNGHAAVAKRDAGRTDAVSVEDGGASRGGGSPGGGLEGRKIRVARRRGAPGPGAAEQRQDSARLEAATDGWARAIATRGRREPAAAAAPAPAAAGVTSPPALDWDRPGDGGKSSSGIAKASAAADADSDSDDSQDSFKALLKAYKRDQERQVSRFSAGAEEKAPAAACQKAEMSAASGGRKAQPASGGRKAQQHPGVEAGENKTMNGSEPGDSAPVTILKDVAVERSDAALKLAAGCDRQSDGDSDAEAGPVDNERLRQVLTKLNPQQVKSLTEDDLRTLVLYLKVRRGADCRMYRQAVNLVRSKGVYKVLQQSRCAADIETSLASLMEKLRVEPEVRAARNTATAEAGAATSAATGGVDDPSRKTGARPRSMVNTRVTKSFEGNGGHVRYSGKLSKRSSLDKSDVGVRNSDVGATAAVTAVSVNGTGSSLPSAGLAGASAAASKTGAAIYSASAAIHATTDYDEEIRQIPSREEDVEEFQRDLRLKTSHRRAARALASPPAAVVDSSSSEDSCDESAAEEATVSARGGRSGGRQRKAVPPRRPATGLAAQSSEVDDTNRQPMFDATAQGESHPQRSNGGTPSRAPVGPWAGYQPQYPHGYPNQMAVPPWNQGYPGYPSGHHASYHHTRPSAWSEYNHSAYPSYPGMYGGGPAGSTSHGGGWGQSGYSGYSYARPDGHPTQHARSWDDLLHTCYNQQTQYLAHMSRFYASSYAQFQS